MVSQPAYGFNDTVADVDRRPGIVLGDPVELGAQVVFGGTQPLDPHAVRPLARRSNAARCSRQLDTTRA